MLMTASQNFLWCTWGDSIRTSLFPAAGAVQLVHFFLFHARYICRVTNLTQIHRICLYMKGKWNRKRSRAVNLVTLELRRVQYEAFTKASFWWHTADLKKAFELTDTPTFLTSVDIKYKRPLTLLARIFLYFSGKLLQQDKKSNNWLVIKQWSN